MSRVDALAGELTDRLFEADPLRPSVLGLPGDHDRLPRLGAAAEAGHRAAYLDIAARAEAVDVTGLDESLTRDVVIQQARAAVDLLDAKLPEFAVSDAFTAPMQLLLITLPMVPLTDQARVSGFLARLAAIPSFVDEVIERQSGSLVPPGFLVDAAIGYFDRLLATPGVAPLSLDVGSRAAERDTLLENTVRPALARYREFLVAELKPRARPAEEAGLCWQPGGLQRYAGLIRAHTTTERSAQELHDIGLALIADLAGEFRALGRRVFGTGELGEVFTRLRTDPALRWDSGEELLAAARTAIARAEAEAPRWFRTVPPQRCEVRAVPETDADAGTIAYYIEPALDGSRPGTYYANTTHAGERFRHVSEAVAYHEAVPGHHFQLSLALGLDLPLLRRIAEVNAYTEGWGLYAERLADEMGLYTGDVARFGLLTQDAMRAARLVVDTGMHALGWSRQRAVDYLRENTPMAPVEIEEEIDRYAGCPGQALSYMAGRLEIERIRAGAERALGERFDLRDFHDVVLRHGILPLPVLDRVVSEWITSR
ncbi:DUF885 domain-containing protein [Amycolatopsis thermophila]|uniref:Uncharacterized protein (DUF885 family) n=1 Tax=Amycolatopsis thermophila TaxID=206084 RepID=A0ABU0F3Z9_9PSEU|nr:DUF885 domain-containing protein [Amycolatopsis thermophila]MDQ0382308.1 uncharacterized protein (DUF885 family) [Amycolatopsis thermophila]